MMTDKRYRIKVELSGTDGILFSLDSYMMNEEEKIKLVTDLVLELTDEGLESYFGDIRAYYSED
jgi:hypothetical protein